MESTENKAVTPRFVTAEEMYHFHERFFRLSMEMAPPEAYHRLVDEFVDEVGQYFRSTTTITSNEPLSTGAYPSFVIFPRDDDRRPLSGSTFISSHEAQSTRANIVTVADLDIIDVDGSLLRRLFFVEGMPRRTVLIGEVMFLEDMSWHDEGEYEFAGFIDKSLECYIKFSKDEIYVDDYAGCKSAYVRTYGELMEFIQRL